jgi:hypothetical protein
LSSTSSDRSNNNYSNITDIALLYEDEIAENITLNATEAKVVYTLLAIDKYHSYLMATEGSNLFSIPWRTIWCNGVAIAGGVLVGSSTGCGICGGIVWQLILSVCMNN